MKKHNKILILTLLLVLIFAAGSYFSSITKNANPVSFDPISTQRVVQSRLDSSDQKVQSLEVKADSVKKSVNENLKDLSVLESHHQKAFSKIEDSIGQTRELIDLSTIHAKQTQLMQQTIHEFHLLIKIKDTTILELKKSNKVLKTEFEKSVEHGLQLEKKNKKLKRRNKMLSSVLIGVSSATITFILLQK